MKCHGKSDDSNTHTHQQRHTTTKTTLAAGRAERHPRPPPPPLAGPRGGVSAHRNAMLGPSGLWWPRGWRGGREGAGGGASSLQNTETPLQPTALPLLYGDTQGKQHLRSLAVRVISRGT
ncbi:hypothetical protein E2C01_021092 [Portunus trituberculatus]|uniref:Uncharacterized protein n=1 Tax=Portunus trituberculatus TaxID=210409 RepID=A0A5B7E3R3_PORTR|nr:hypothetical protein [Portunus trituberculatus]